MILNASIANEEFQSAEQGEQAQTLIEKLLTADHSSWESRLYLTEAVIGPDEVDEDWLPPHEVTLAVDPKAGYGAIRWVGIEPPEGPYVTHNSAAEPEVELLADGGTPHYFPRSAALPLSDIRKALLEFVSTCKRPGAVQWQEFNLV